MWNSILGNRSTRKPSGPSRRAGARALCLALAAAVFAGVGAPAWSAPPKQEETSPQQHETPSLRPVPRVKVKQPTPSEALEPGRRPSLDPAAERALGEQLARPQAAIERVARVGGGPVSVGATVRLRVGLRNTGSVPAEVAVAAFTDRFTSALRSPRTVTIPPRGVNYSLELEVGIDPSMMRGDEFRTTVFLALPDAPLSGPPLAMGWRDNNNSDNTAEVSFPVEVPVWAVRVTLASIDVDHDCDRSLRGRDTPGEWRLSMQGGHRPVPYGRPEFEFNENGVSWEGSVRSGGSYPVGISMDMPNVSADHSIRITVSGMEHDPVNSDRVGGVGFRMAPEEWKQTFRLSYHSSMPTIGGEPIDDCLGGFTAHFEIGHQAVTVH